MDTAKKTRNILNIYERTAIIGTRIQQLVNGAETTLSETQLSNLKDKHPRTIAYTELQLKKIPMKLQRQLPNGEIEIWRLEDMIILNND